MKNEKLIKELIRTNNDSYEEIRKLKNKIKKLNMLIDTHACIAKPAKLHLRKN